MTDLFVLCPIVPDKESVIDINGVKCIKADICIVDMIKLRYDEGIIDEAIKDYANSINKYTSLKQLFTDNGINPNLIDKYLEYDID